MLSALVSRLVSRLLLGLVQAPPRFMPWLALALLVMLGFQTMRLAGTQSDLAALGVSQSKQAVIQAQQSQAATETKAGALLEHASAQQDNTHAYTQTLASLETARAAHTARIASLQHDIRATATRNAQLAGDAAACRDLADQHQRLAALAGEGAGVVGELVGLVERRDSAIALLQGQVMVDRELLVTLTKK